MLDILFILKNCFIFDVERFTEQMRNFIGFFLKHAQLFTLTSTVSSTKLFQVSKDSSMVEDEEF